MRVRPQLHARGRTFGTGIEGYASRSVLTFIVRRLAYSIPVIIIASALVFGFTRATTDPLARLAQSRDAAELLPRERHRLGLDKPLVTQYTRWAKDFV
ncbi:MAG: peptide/nickel transport system permease protein, partial [Acidimicrobiaceae bacterium]|nr:peptide/nickel transport system permease protein [Acidimicrobiaceae bacterium]